MAAKRRAQPAPYQVVARRFRPRSFAEVVGQGAILHSLAKSLTSGRIPHALLFSGSRGVGKTTLARIFARCLNCERGPTPEPCGDCEPCLSILEDRNADFVEIDAASHNLVDDIRALRERVAFASMGSRFKVYLLDEVHMLTRSAFNAFLKTLEEPPANVVFILATTELHKVPDTIRSRCQVLSFRQMGEADIVRRLTDICRLEKANIDDAVLQEIARGSRGGMRDAETVLERVLAAAGDTVIDLAGYRQLFHRLGEQPLQELAAALIAGDAAAALRFVDEAVTAGADERETLGEILEVLREVLLMAVDGVDTALVAATGDARTRLQELAERAGTERLDPMIQAGLIGRERIRMVEDRRLVLELTLLRMASAGRLPVLADLVQALSGGATPGEARAPLRVDPPAAAPESTGDLQARLRVWLEGTRPLLAQTLDHCEVSGPDEAGVVSIVLRADRKLHRDRLESPGCRQTLEEGVAAVLGRSCRLSFADRGSKAPPAPPATKPAARPPTKRRPDQPPTKRRPDQPPTKRRPDQPPTKRRPGAVDRVAKTFDGRIVPNDDS